MKQLIFALIAIVFSAAAQSEPRGLRILSCEQKFQLKINTAFHADVDFIFCQRSDKFNLWYSVAKTEWVKQPTDKVVSKTSKMIPLSKEQQEIIMGLYANALIFDAFFQYEALDGSSWCIESFRATTHLNACFQSPGSMTEERKLTGLYQLGQYLWEITDLSSDKSVELY